MNKRFIFFCFGFIALGLFCFYFFFTHSDQYIRDQINFVTYEDLTEKNIAITDTDKIRKIHTKCFEGVKRRNLLNFWSQSQSLDGGGYDKGFLEEQVDRYLEKSRIEKVKYFQHTENVTILRYHDDIIGLYSCSPENTISDNTIMLWNVCISPSMRGRGIGHVLIKHAIKRCYQPDQGLSLVVYKDDELAQSLYKKHGFKFVDLEYSLEDQFEFYNKYLMKFYEK